jgi:hypothetical protein
MTLLKKARTPNDATIITNNFYNVETVLVTVTTQEPGGTSAIPIHPVYEQ